MKWPIVTLGELARPRQWPILAKADMTASGYPLFGANGRIGFASKFTHESPTLIVGCRGSCGSLHIAPAKSYVNGNAMALDDLKSDRVLISFLYRFLEQRGFADVISGSSQPQITGQNIARIEIPLPPLDEQRRIAAILDQANALRQMRREAIARSQELLNSIFAAHFSGETTFGPAVTLAELADIQVGYPFQSSNYTSEADGVRLCRGANVLPGRLDWSDLAKWPSEEASPYSHLLLRQGDIIMAMDRPWISEGFKISHVNPSDLPALLVQRVARIRVSSEELRLFLYHLLRQPGFAKHCKPTETTVPHISPKEIRNYRVSRPSAEALTTFTAEVRSLAAYEERQQAQLAGFNALFSALQRRAFTGELTRSDERLLETA